MNRPVGHLLRTIYIDADLKNNINEILRADSPDSPQIEGARAAIYGLGRRGNPYSCATQIRAYLEEKTRVGSEPWVYPVAGDLFLDGLEQQLIGLGPNLFQDYYNGVMACYKAGNDAARMAQAPFYSIDLLLKRMVTLFMRRREVEAKPQTEALRFMRAEMLGYEGQMQEFQRLADRALQDAVDFLLSNAARDLDKRLSKYLVDMSEIVRPAMKRWPAVLKTLETTEGTDDEQLLRMLEAARQMTHVPLECFLREDLSELHKSDAPTQDILETDPFVVHAYEGGETWMALGNQERDETAYAIACRRYDRAVALFHSIHDRTSEAKAHVERARALIQQGGARPLARRSLREAVRLVYAHKKNLPPGSLPELDDRVVFEFLDKKGYSVEAAAFRESLGMG
jgi:hypothetical protein